MPSQAHPWYPSEYAGEVDQVLRSGGLVCLDPEPRSLYGNANINRGISSVASLVRSIISEVSGSESIDITILDEGNVSSVPYWYAEVKESLEELLELPESWDSYCAKRVDRQATEKVMDLIRNFSDYMSYKPSIVPLPDGEIQVEWHVLDDKNLELVINAASIVSLFYYDTTGSEEEIDSPSEDQLRAYLVKLR